MRYLLVVTLILFGFFSQAQTATQIIQAYIDTVSNGDINNWSKIKTLYYEGNSSYDQSRYEQNKPNFGATKISLNKFYKIFPDSSKREMYQEDVLTSVFYTVPDGMFMLKQDTLLRLKDKGLPGEPYFDALKLRENLKKSKSVKLVGEEKIDGDVYYRIALKMKDTIRNYYFNKRTRLLGYWTNSPDGAVSNMTKVYNYQKFGDYLIPLSEIKTNNGIVFFWFNIIKLELNNEFPDDTFVMKRRISN